MFNRAAVHGGHWAWTASLRYLFVLPLLLPLMPWQGGIAPVTKAMRAAPGAWLLWSGIGFVLFYMLLSYAAASGPSWLIAASFQTTVVAGMLCAPLLYNDARARIPRAALGVGVLIIAGVLLMQFGHARGTLDAKGWIALLCVVASAFAYPLGNRGLLLHLERKGVELNATQRVFGLTLASQPAWLALAAWAWLQVGPPSTSQLWLALGVAISAGVVATILFFQATGMVRDNATALGAAEAMQAAKSCSRCCWAWPSSGGLASRAGVGGAALVVSGIVLFAWIVARDARRSARDAEARCPDRGRLKPSAAGSGVSGQRTCASQPSRL
jgi:hypothetical protein